MNGTRSFLTVLSLLIYGGLSYFWNLTRDAYIAQVGVRQLSNDPIEYSLAQKLVRGEVVVESILFWVLIGVLVMIWWTPIRKKLKGNSAPVATLLASTLLLTTAACAPVKLELLEEIGNNETGFVIPLEGDSLAQAKFDSIEFLEARKVAGKRVSLSQRSVKTGRGYWRIRYIPTEKLIKVSRAPVAREWTQATGTGTSTTNQAIVVESLESIGFYVGTAITAYIEEPNTAKFLYYYPSGSLEVVMDSVMRNSTTQFLSTEFGKRTLAGGINDKADIFNELKEALKEEYTQYGITITTVGLSEGLTYINESVQTEIDNVFKASAAATKQAIDNQKDVVMASAAYSITLRNAQAQAEAIEVVNNALRNASDQYTTLEWIRAWKESGGPVPSVVGNDGGGFLLNVPIGPPIAAP